MTDISREKLAALLEGEAENVAAERVRSGEDAVSVLLDLRSTEPRYDDAISRNARGTFDDIVTGLLGVTP